MNAVTPPISKRYRRHFIVGSALRVHHKPANATATMIETATRETIVSFSWSTFI